MAEHGATSPARGPRLPLARNRRLLLALAVVAVIVAIAAPVTSMTLAQTGRDPRNLW